MKIVKGDFLISGIWYYPWSIFVILTRITNPLLSIKIFLGRAAAKLHEIRLRKSGLHFYVRSPMDVWSVKETLLDGFYERFGIEVGQGWVVVDVGAGIGDFAILAASRHATNRVVAFEPFEASYQLMQRNLDTNKITNVEPVPVAIGAKSGVTSLHIAANEPLQIQSGVAAAESETAQVPCLSLQDAFSEHGIQLCDVIKLDCEGAEYEIVLNTPDDVWARIRRIVMEYHDDISGYDHADLVQFLQEKGYRVWVLPNYVHANLGYLYACQPDLC